MADFETKLGEQILREAFPRGGWATEALASKLGGVLGVAFGAVAQSFGVGQTEEESSGVLSALLGGVGGGPANAALALDVAAPSGGLSSLAPEVAHSVRRLAALLAIPFRNAGAAPAEQPGDTRPPPEPDLDTLLDGLLQSNERTRTAEQNAQVQEQRQNARALEEAAAGVANTAAASPHALDNVVRALRGIAKYLAQRGIQLEKWLELELLEMFKRALLASAIARATQRLPFKVASNRAIGNRVHREIQSRYVEWFGARRDIAIERWVPPNGPVEQVVIGPSTRRIARPLLEVAGSRLDRDGFWQTLLFALNGAKFRKGSWLRSDLVDRQAMSIWEIKPVEAGTDGVYQEANYRIFFNLARQLVHALLPDQPKVIPPLRSGGYFVANDRLAGGLAAVLQSIDVSKEAKEPAVALPFQVGALPGLVLYLVFRGPGVRELLLLVVPLVLAALEEAKRFLDESARALREQLQQALEAARELLQEIEQALEPLAQLVMLLLIVAMLVVAFVMSAGGTSSVPVGSPPAPFLRHQGTDGQTVARTLPRSLRDTVLASAVHSGDRLVVTFAPKSPRRRAPTTSVYIGAIEVHELPVEAVGDFVAHCFGVVHDLSRLSAERLRSKYAAVS